jgi:uncharacterized protein YukE
MASPMQTAKDAAKQTAQQQKDKAAQNLDGMAEALRGASGKMNESQQQMLGNIAERAAGGLQQISEKLRTKDVDGLLRDAQSFAREQPVAFFGLSLAAGFLAMRFLKSSQSGDSRSQAGPETFTSPM